MTQIMTPESQPSSTDAPLASLLSLDISQMSEVELREFIATSRQLQNSPQTLRAKLETESKTLGGRKPKKQVDITDLLSDDDD